MQFRAGILYAVLFVVVAAGAYGVVATASAPAVSGDDVEVDHVLEEEGQEFEVDGQTFNVTSLQEDSGTVEYVNESAIIEVQWSDGDTVLLEADGEEYEVLINQPEGADDEAEDEEAEGEENGEEADGEDAEGEEAEGEENGEEAADDEDTEGEDANGDADEEADPESFSLIGEYNDDEIQVEEFGDEDDRPYVITEDDDGERTAVPIEEFDGIDAEIFEEGDTVEFYDEEGEEVVTAEVTDIDTEAVTLEYEGEEVTEHDLEHADDVTLNDQEFAVYFDGETASLSSDIDALEAQQDAVEEFHDRVTGLWWVIALSVMAIVITAGLAFMPVRG